MGLTLADFDPTVASSPLGGLVRSGISALPGGGTAITAMDQAAARDAAAARARTASSVGAPPYAGLLPTGVPRWAIYAGGAAVAALVLYLVLRK